MKRRSVFLLACCLAFGAAPLARASTQLPFTEQAFAAAQQEGKPILVHVNASWCPTCAKQRPILSQLEATPQFRDLIVYQVDFDTQKDVVKQMGVRMQSTLIVFHGATEKGRATGITDPDAIRNLLAEANR